MNLNLSGAGSYPSEHTADYTRPPALHWGLVLVFHMLTFGIFSAVWMFRQAIWIGRIDPMSNPVVKLSLAFLLSLLGMVGDDSPAWERSVCWRTWAASRHSPGHISRCVV